MTDITLEQRARELLAKARGDVTLAACAWGQKLAEGTATREDAAAFDDAVERLEEVVALRLPAGEDWVLVPREPTPEMREAFKNIPLTLDDMLFQTRSWAGLEPGVRNVDDVGPAADRRDFGKRYDAMIAAAPRHETGRGLGLEYLNFAK